MNLGTDILEQAQPPQLTTGMLRLPQRRTALDSRAPHGSRALLVEHCCLAPGQRIVEFSHGPLGCSDFIAPEVIAQMSRVQLVSAAAEHLACARARWAGLPRVEVLTADAGCFDAGIGVDRVLLSYALSAAPDWRRVLRNAYRMLKPGGLIGVIDHHLPTPPYGAEARTETLRERCWRAWFGRDGVRPDPAHRYYLNGQFQPVVQHCGRDAARFMSGLSLPYFIFIGRK